jgi:conjugal transfer mating pair stabilization protein TraN
MVIHVLLKAATVALASIGLASAQLSCGVDLDLDGFVDQATETTSCTSGPLCPIDKTACDIETSQTGPKWVCPRGGESLDLCGTGATPGTCLYVEPCVDPVTGNLIICPEPMETAEVCVANPNPTIIENATCPLAGGGACTDDGSGDLFCSSACYDLGQPGNYVDQSRPREYTQDDGARDATGACLDQIRIFEGFPMDCRPVGAQTIFKNCCRDNGKIITDSGGSAAAAPGMVAAAPALFSGLGAAYSAFSSGGGAAAAASQGTSAMLAAFDPTTLAIAAAATLMIQMLDLGCDAQDMETGVLRGSGMCHYIGDYCSVNTPFGCIQKKRAHCCFNTKLARLIHEQGRPQLVSYTSLPGAGWGTPEAPYCEGFTPEQFQSLDFGAMDLSEYYNELATRSAAEMQVIMQGKVDQYANDHGL